MNFLAHFFLSASSEPYMIGNFVADFLNNKEVAQLPIAIQEGVQLHRLIDTYTDNHPLIRQGTERLRPHHRKYAPVVVDIFYDYFLATHWDRYSPTPLAEFSHSVYQVLEKYAPALPPLIQARIPPMVAADWLSQYQKIDGIAYTFERMKKRVSRPEQIAGAVEHLQHYQDAFEEEFNGFFPEVIDRVEAWLVRKE